MGKPAFAVVLGRDPDDPSVWLHARVDPAPGGGTHIRAVPEPMFFDRKRAGRVLALLPEKVREHARIVKGTRLTGVEFTLTDDDYRNANP